MSAIESNWPKRGWRGALGEHGGGGNFVGGHRMVSRTRCRSAVAEQRRRTRDPIYVSEMTSIDEVKSVITESLGVSSASGDDVPLNVIQTGLIEAQYMRSDPPAPGGVPWRTARSRRARSGACAWAGARLATRV